METVQQLLARSAMEVRERSASAGRVGLAPDDLEQLADRLMQAATLPPDHALAGLRMLARLFGEERGAWEAVSPAFVELMDRLRDAP